MLSNPASKLEITKSSSGPESLNINFKKGVFRVTVNGFRFIDKDTKQYVIYVPSLDISAYGETLEKAQQMIRSSFDYFTQHLTSLTPEEIHKELTELGWRKGYFKKQYSKAYVDINGQLQDFNAENNQVERLSLTAA